MAGRSRLQLWAISTGLVCLLATATACGSQQVASVTLILDPGCRDGGDIYLDDGTRWILDHNSDVPTSWRGREEVGGTLTATKTDHGYFVADDGTRLAVTNGFRKLSCTLWEWRPTSKR